MSLDDVFELDEPRPRRLWAMLGVVVPVGIFAGVAAWFIRSYVFPPMMTISSEPMTLASSDPAPAAEPPPPPLVETTGTAPTLEPPALTAPPPVFATLAYAPMGAMTAAAQPQAPDIDVTTLDVPDSAQEASEPVAASVPLPHTRPRVTTATIMVPLPRPRPQI